MDENKGADREDAVKCRICGGGMERVSEVDRSPLILACISCGHKEHLEIQIPPPWPPAGEEPETRSSHPEPAPDRINRSDNRGSRYDPSGTPVTVGNQDEETKVIPFGWILIAGLILVCGVILVISC